MGAFVTYSGSADLTVGALSLVTNFAATGRTAVGFVGTVSNFRKLDHITLKATVAITETVTLVLNSAKGSTYDTTIDTTEMSAEQNYQYVPLSPIYLGPGDNLTLACTNANTTGSVAATIVCEEA